MFDLPSLPLTMSERHRHVRYNEGTEGTDLHLTQNIRGTLGMFPDCVFTCYYKIFIVLGRQTSFEMNQSWNFPTVPRTFLHYFQETDFIFDIP